MIVDVVGAGLAGLGVALVAAPLERGLDAGLVGVGVVDHERSLRSSASTAARPRLAIAP